jgi:hypothetical protein
MEHQDWPGWADDPGHGDDTGHVEEPGHLHDPGHLDDPGQPHDHGRFDDHGQLYPPDHLDEPVGSHYDYDLPGHDLPEHDPYSADYSHADPGTDTADSPDIADSPDVPEIGVVDAPVGTDPDADPHADGYWADDHLPPPLDLPDPPAPVDGYPWADADLLGSLDPHGPDPMSGTHPADPGLPAAPAGDLLDYAGVEDQPDGDAWSALLGSDDPATSTLARWWNPDM